ncbi:MAG: hypothetical protein ABR551_02675 [Gemmatimonadales bacterium]
MNEPHPTRSPRLYARWLLPAVLVLIGVALFFWLGPDTAPVGQATRFGGQP